MEEKLVQREEGPARFMVPTLDVEITPAALMAGQITGAPAVASGPERVAITGGRPDYAALVSVAKTPEEVGKLWTQANQAGHLDDALAAAIKAKATALGARLKTPEQRQAEEVSDAAGESGWKTEPHQDGPDEEGAYVAEVVEDNDIDALWFQIVAAAGTKGWTTDETEVKFAEANRGDMPGTATPEQLRGFLAAVKAGEIA